MNKRQSGLVKQSIIIFFAILGLFICIGIFCYTQFEIVPGTRWEAPSREVRANPYYALEKWIEESSCRLRTISMGNTNTILNAPEKIIYAENSRLNWTGDLQLLIPWLEEGGRLIISLDSAVNINLQEFMKSLGIWSSYFSGYDELVDNDTDVHDADEQNTRDENNMLLETNDTSAESSPTFDWQISFKITGQNAPVDNILIMKNPGGIKLVKFEIGKGFLVFTGNANFLHNSSLRREENAQLAAELFFAAGPASEAAAGFAEQGILIIRTLSGDRQVFGSLADRGNPAALAASLVLLVVIGFWMVIPSFGRYTQETEKPGKPLKERFLAEGRFLKKYHALGKYMEVYKREFEQQNRSKGLQELSLIMNRASEESQSQIDQLDQIDQIREISLNQFIIDQKILMEKLQQLRTIKGNI